LCKVACFNVAEAIVNAVLKNKLPAKHQADGFVYFSKLETPKPTFSAFEKVTQINEVTSPPFPLNNNAKAISLVAGYGDSLDEARGRFEEAKKRLVDIISRGK
jgi:hypothetical protein